MISVGFVLQYDDYNWDPFRNIPYTALYLLTILEARLGDQVELSLVDLRGVKKESLVHYCPPKDLYLYTVSTPVYMDTVLVVNALRAAHPQALHVGGGPHVSLFPEQCAQLFDSIVLNDGEESVVALVTDFMNATLQPQYQQQGVNHFSDYPYPDRKFVAPTSVGVKGLLGGEYANLNGAETLFSRGCPFNCYFCANQKLSYTPVMFRSPQQIRHEIEYLKREYRIEALAIKDDNAIPVNRDVAIGLLEAIGEGQVKWRGQSRANGIRPDMVKLAQQAGCVDIAIGLESVSPQVLAIVNKKIKLAEAKAYIGHLKAAGIGVRLNLILGLPGEPDDILKQTIDFVDEVGPSSVLLCLFCPVPGSEIFQNPEAFGIRIDSLDWEKYRWVFARFDQDELPDFVYHYQETTPWGKGRSNEANYQDYMACQAMLRERGLVF
jgi:anaerobic magnesium-protoporphyrin IX monomethyl ester cyclase